MSIVIVFTAMHLAYTYARAALGGDVEQFRAEHFHSGL